VQENPYWPVEASSSHPTRHTLSTSHHSGPAVCGVAMAAPLMPPGVAVVPLETVVAPSTAMALEAPHLPR